MSYPQRRCTEAIEFGERKQQCQVCSCMLRSCAGSAPVRSVLGGSSRRKARGRAAQGAGAGGLQAARRKGRGGAQGQGDAAALFPRHLFMAAACREERAGARAALGARETGGRRRCAGETGRGSREEAGRAGAAHRHAWRRWDFGWAGAHGAALSDGRVQHRDGAQQGCDARARSNGDAAGAQARERATATLAAGGRSQGARRR
jgi:hypothetical protein